MSGDSPVADPVPATYADYAADRAQPRLTDWLRAELDREGAAASERRQARLAGLFSRTVDLEVAFFDAAYEGKHDPETLETGGDA